MFLECHNLKTDTNLINKWFKNILRMVGIVDLVARIRRTIE
jgi:hypothetical protein